jgi:redox-sensitive bicupin YhaK (pirin superfamily)
MPDAKIHRRAVAKVTDSEIGPGMTPSHRVRPLVHDGDFGHHDPFLFLMEDWFDPHVFDLHPHRGMETVTFVLEGELDHREKGKPSSRFVAGDAMWMTAGRGVIHNEAPVEEKTVHTLQLWVNLPAAEKMAEPRYQVLKRDAMPVWRADGAEVRLFSGRTGDLQSSTLNHVPVTMIEVTLQPHARVAPDLPARYNGFLYVIAGSGFFGVERTPARAGQIVWMELPGGDGRSEFSIQAGEESLRVLLWAGEPLHESVIAYGPFVMNTKDQIRQAFADYQAGRFG